MLLLGSLVVPNFAEWQLVPSDKESLIEVTKFVDHAATFQEKIQISTECSQY